MSATELRVSPTGSAPPPDPAAPHWAGRRAFTSGARGLRGRARLHRHLAAMEPLEGRLVFAVVIPQGGELPDLTRTNADIEESIDLSTVFVDGNPYVRFETELGAVDVELRNDLFPAGGSPETNPVANFLGYVNADAYDNTIIHGVGAGALVQGGEFDPSFQPIPQRNPVAATGLTVSNTRGTLALPKPGGSIGGKPSGWFFNLGDNLPLDGDAGGYTVFGRVLGPGAAGNGGISVLDSIAGTPTAPFPDPFVNLPVQGAYTFPDAITPDQTVAVNNVRQILSLPGAAGEDSVYTIEVSSSNGQIVQASLGGSGLNLAYPGSAGTAQITIEVKDRAGTVIASDSFSVDVQDLGRPDPAFSGDGLADVEFAGTDTIDEVADVATDAEGRIIVVGSNRVDGDDRFAIARIGTDGTPDLTFNTQKDPVTLEVIGGGILNLALVFEGLTSDERATAVEILPDGKILFCGVTEIDDNGDGVFDRSDVVIGRIDPLGFFDTSFGDPNPADPTGASRLGYVQTNLTSVFDPARLTRDRANGMVIRPDGKIVIVGSSDAGDDGTDDVLVARYNPDGTLDPTFGVNGVRLVPFGRAPNDPPVRSRDRANAVTLQADGKIIAVGSLRRETDGFSGFAIVRLTADGGMDDAFGPNGDGKFGFDAMPVRPAIQITANEAFAVKVQPNTGKIIVGGTSAFMGLSANSAFDSDFGVIRLNPDGTPDLSFSTDGRTTTDRGALESLSDLFLQSDGSIIVTGKSTSTVGNADTATKVVVVAYEPDGSVLEEFGQTDNGTTILFTNPAPGSTTGGTSLSGGTAMADTPVQRVASDVAGGGFVTADAASDFAALFDRLVREKQGVIDSTPGGGLVVTGARDRVVQVAVLQDDANQPAVFIQFDEVTVNGVPSSTFDVTIVDDVAVSFDSIADGDLEIRLLFGDGDFVGDLFRFESLMVPTGVFTADGKPVLVATSQNSNVLVARYVFVPPGGSWDTGENGVYELAIAEGQIEDVRGTKAAPGRFDNKLDVNIPQPPDPPTAILQPRPPLNQAGQTEFRFTVVYTAAGDPGDPQARIDRATVDVGDVTVVSSDGNTTLEVRRVEIGDPVANQLRVDYVIAKRDGTAFTAADSAKTYKVTLVADAVRDLRGRPVARNELNGVITLSVPAVGSLPDPGPTAVAVVQGVSGGAGATSTTFTVVYTDPNGGDVDGATIDSADVRVSAPGGATSFPVTLMSRTPNSGNANSITATYQFAAPSGTFRASDNGTYTLTLQPEQVFDANGNAAGATQLGQFTVTVADLPTIGPDFTAVVSGVKGSAFIPGAKGRATIAVQNVGDAMTTTQTVAVRLVLRPDAGGPDIDVPGTDRTVTFKAAKTPRPGRTPKPAKAPKAARVSFLFPDVTTLGGYTLAAKVDPAEEILEKGPGGESNNVVGVPVSIDKPDLTIGQVTPGTFKVAKRTTFLVTVDNASAVSLAKGTKATIQLTAVPESGGTSVALPVGKAVTVKPGKVLKVSTNTLALPAGAYRIRAELVGVADKNVVNNSSLSEVVQLVL